MYVGKTPNLLQKVGCEDAVMLMSQGHIRDINHAKSKDNRHYHGLKPEIIKQIPNQLKNPVMIYDSISDNNENAICVLTSLKDGDLPIIITIRANSNENNKYLDIKLETISVDKSNFVTSMYGKNGFKEHIKEIIDKDNVLYANKSKTQKLFSDIGLELPNRLNSLGFDKIIHPSRNIVKNNFMQEDENYSGESKKSRFGVEEEAPLPDNIFRNTKEGAEKYRQMKKENERLKRQLERAHMQLLQNGL